MTSNAMPSQPPFDWQQVDQTLANFMTAEVSEEFGQIAQADLQQIHYQNMGNGNGLAVPSGRLEMHRLRTDEVAARYYAVYCEVWRSQQRPLTPEFLRAICPNRLQGLMSSRVTFIGSEFSMEQMRNKSLNNEWLKSAMAEFKRSMDRLYAKWVRHVEVDARGLEYMLAAAQNNSAVDIVASQVVHARAQLRIAEARLASIDAQITSCGRALSATQLRQPDAYRIKSLEQLLERLNTDKKQFEARRDQWQLSLNNALSRSAELRKYDISDQQALLVKTAEDQKLTGNKAGGAQIWHGLHLEFNALREEELRKDPNNKKDRWLRARVTRDDQAAEQLDISEGVDEGFRARFDVLATRAGIALGAQLNNSPALEFWLHALFEDFRAHRSRGLFAADEKGGIILRVCEASATYSARLERAALEQTPFAHASFPLTSPAPVRHTDGKDSPSGEQKPTGIADSGPPAADPREGKKRPRPRKRDLSNFLDAARLTERQRDCISLRLEYGLTVTEIAQHLDIGRKTVDEHIAAAKRKIDVAQMKSKGKTQSDKIE